MLTCAYMKCCGLQTEKVNVTNDLILAWKKKKEIEKSKLGKLTRCRQHAWPNAEAALAFQSSRNAPLRSGELLHRLQLQKASVNLRRPPLEDALLPGRQNPSRLLRRAHVRHGLHRPTRAEIRLFLVLPPFADGPSRLNASPKRQRLLE